MLKFLKPRFAAILAVMIEGLLRLEADKPVRAVLQRRPG